MVVSNEQGAAFLRKVFPHLHESEAVLEKASESQDPISRLVAFLEGGGVDLESMASSYVIKEDDIPESYFEQRSHEPRAVVASRIIGDQKASLDYWVHHLNDYGTDYPAWVYYWVMEGMRELGSYEDGMFNKRDEGTAAPFAEPHHLALGQTMDEIRQQAIEKSVDDIQIRSFMDIYSSFIRNLGFFEDKEFLEAHGYSKFDKIYLKILGQEFLTDEDLIFLYLPSPRPEERKSNIDEILERRSSQDDDMNRIVKSLYPDLDYNSAFEGSLDLSWVKTIGNFFKLPKSVNGTLNLRGLEYAESLTLPETIDGDLELHRLRSAMRLRLPKIVSGGINLEALTSADGLTFPEIVGGYLSLMEIAYAKELTLPKIVGGDLRLDLLQSADGLTFPEVIGGDLWLSDLRFIEGATLPKTIGGSLYLNFRDYDKKALRPFETVIDRFSVAEVYEGETALRQLEMYCRE